MEGPLPHRDAGGAGGSTSSCGQVCGAGAGGEGGLLAGALVAALTVSDPSFRMQQLLKKILYLIIISLVPPHSFRSRGGRDRKRKRHSSVRSCTNRTSVWLSPASCSVGGLGRSSEGMQGSTRRGKLASI